MRIKGIRDERGISTVVVAVSMLGIFGALVLSLDAGNLWSSRRAMVTATDTAALAGARTSVGHLTAGACPLDVRAAVINKLIEQEPTANLVDCQLQPTNQNAGYLTVDARKPVQVRFGPVLNVGDQAAFSSTSVAYGFPTGAEGLRPMGICVENPHIQEWLALKNGTLSQEAYLDQARTDPTNHFLGPTGGLVHRIYFVKANARNCGGADDAAGNWGWMDYTDANNMNNDLRDWTQVGHQDLVNIAVTPDGYTCTQHEPLNGCVNGTTGSRGNSLNSELDMLLTTGISVWIPLFDRAVGPGNNVLFTIRGFVGMIVRDYVTTGAERNHHVDVEFVDAIRSGGCCTQFGLNTGALATKICATDHDPAAASTRCSPS